MDKDRLVLLACVVPSSDEGYTLKEGKINSTQLHKQESMDYSVTIN